MKYKLLFLLPGLAGATWLIFTACGCDLSSGSRPQALQGVINLSSWDFAQRGAIALDGEYEFYWQQLVPPEEFSRGQLSPGHFMPVPDAWKGHTVDGVNLPGAGYATYRLTVLLNPGAPRLALKFLDMGTAFTVFANGRKILAVGAVGQTAETSAPRYAP